MKKSKFIAVALICVMLFSVASGFAKSGGGENFLRIAAGSIIGAVVGGIAGFLILGPSGSGAMAVAGFVFVISPGFCHDPNSTVVY